ncbi:MAG TPA: ribonuclease E/G, partial [Synergistaceae bacterium]|nr:ribonuclease E/G [Synergistaceae bacterium]
ALTVIDVNTGKFVGDVDLRHTVLDTNLEAAGEIARQLRLRGIGGIVVVDFIDMDHAQDRKALLDRLEEVFRSDRCRAKIFGVTELGLVEITRKRARVDLRTALTRGCPECGGAGWVMREESLAMVLKRFLRKVCLSGRAEAYLLEVHPALGTYVMENCLGLWEEEFGRRFFLVKAPEFAWGKFRLDAQGTLGQMEHRLQVWKTREPFSGVLGTAIP